MGNFFCTLKLWKKSVDPFIFLLQITRSMNKKPVFKVKNISLNYKNYAHEKVFRRKFSPAN